MANPPGKGKPGKSTSVQGGKSALISPNQRQITAGQASISTSSTQAEKDAAFALNLERKRANHRKIANTTKRNYGRKASFFKPGCQNVNDVYEFTKANQFTSPSQGRFLNPTNYVFS